MLISFFILVFILGIGLLIFLRIRDARFLKGATRDSLGSALKAEIEEEKSLFARHSSRFNEALERAEKKKEKLKPRIRT